MDSGLMFPGCPAHPDHGGGRCGLPVEVRCRVIVLVGACTRVTVTGRGDARAPAAARGRGRPATQEVER